MDTSFKSETNRRSSAMGFETDNLPLFENSSDAIIVLQDGIIRNVNANGVKVLRYEAHELVGHPYGDFVHPDDASLVDIRYRKRMNHESVPQVYPFRLITKDGEIVWFEIHAIEILWDGRPASLTFFNNITERVRAQEALQESEKVTRGILNAIPDTIIRIMESGRITTYKGPEGSMAGGKAPYAGSHLSDFLPREKYEEAMDAIGRALANHTVQRFEFKWAEVRGTQWYEARIIALAGNEVLGILRNITERKRQERALTERLHHLETRVKQSHAMGTIIGRSKPMQDVLETILKASRTTANVIVYGESGTGKELVSKAVHDLSDRAGGKFVPVNCAAIPEKLMESEFFGYKKGAFSGADRDTKGLLELAHGGTLFMDELGEIDLNMQAKLLRAIEGGGFLPVGGRETVYPDIRIIAATNKNPEELVKHGLMREDFFYRISVIPITLPPLRDRLDDLPFLIHHFLEKLVTGEKLPVIPSHVMSRLQAHPWPGNIRELQNVIHRYITMTRLDLPIPEPHADLPPEPREEGCPRPLGEVLAEVEKAHILRTLESTRWQKARAAELLGVHRKTLFRKLKGYGIE
ncbi:sigma 54-interacting transcriptional regulator [Desulfoluna butyratoxydans]|nr:sigma 54-interacting transcriptional regulator [Desulfoluna butyratoxydans]